MSVLETGDGRLAYDVRGDGPPLVLLHPGGINRAGELHARTMVLTGALDTSDIHEVADLLERSGRDVRRVSFDDAGHQAALERPREFEELLTAFLRAH
ncbi:alpha/beta fold hydrolase [Amycolatopsis sp. YIM 10]|uniref:alpha/beta fold hydrolase n=1 Tax=Amycolatopsis sp. YIM 10 TaxID=2653857 RepID=UPI00128FE704|nr:hypothetical protein [Amycolatopsis sp. YIM 10]QFU87069.1 hypothetical protein YIM_09305 [Amycolatopsis sp. YIM 10]